MKIGIYLGYGPRTLLHKEGLGRYLASIIKGFIEKGHKVTVAMPKWLISTFQILMEDFEINPESIDYIIEYKTPIIWDIYEHMHKKTKKKRGLKRKVLLQSLKFAEWLLNGLLSISNILLLIIVCVVFLLFAVVVVPVVLLLLLCYLIVFGIKMLVRKQDRILNRCKNKAFDLISSFKGTSVDLYSRLFQNMQHNIQRSLSNRINKSKADIDLWYCPSVFWPAFNLIQAKKVINAPDLVVMDYPLHWYHRPSVIDSSLLCEETICEGEYFITYSNYLKESLLMKRYAKKEENVIVIPHMVNDMAKYVTIDSELALRTADSSVYTKAFCRNLLYEARFNVINMSNYVKKFDFENVKYIFYASQARPHKNLMNLLKAYQYVLRKGYKGIKLFLTGDLYSEQEIREYLIDNKLQYDVLCFYNLTSQQLAALYHEAELVVNPTLYEGGFPFTFGEGMSVGVPSLMSDIPQVREVVGDEMDACLFDPYDVDDIAKTIIWGLDNKEQICELQKPIYGKLSSRSMEQYIDDYINAFTIFGGC